MHNDVDVPAPVTSVLTANGRIFYDVDEGHPDAWNLPDHFSLFARDAFNGSLLWKRPLPNWYQGDEYRRGNPPVVMQRRMACDGDYLYLTESDKGPVMQLDAATGKVLKTYKGTENSMEIIAADGFIYIVMWQRGDPKFVGYHKWFGTVIPSEKKEKPESGEYEAKIETVTTSVMKIDPRSGRIIWQRSDSDVSPIFPLSLAVKEDGVFLKTPTELVRLAADSGKTVWKTGIGLPPEKYLEIANVKKRNWTRQWLIRKPDNWYCTPQFIGKCIVYRDLVLTTTYNTLFAVSKKDGKILWDTPSWEGLFLPADILPVGDKVYVGSQMGKEGFKPVDLATGKTDADIDISKGGMIHHRCYRRLATTKYLLTSKAGVEFTDFETKETSHNQWTRGSCLAGFLPGNGLLYVTPHPCACFTRTKMNGMIAYDRNNSDSAGVQLPSRLQKGPAYNSEFRASRPNKTDWPMFRRLFSRSGSTPAVVNPQLRQVWKATPGGKLSALSAVGNSLFAASIDKHKLYCIDTNSGKTKWIYTAGARIDSPPTITNGRAVFGCHNGWTYCLNADSGKLIWSFHASPREKNVAVFGQLESPWPVFGAVPVNSDPSVNGGAPVVYINAGRNSYLDSGIFLCALDLKSGKLLYENKLNGSCDADGNPEVERIWAIKGIKNDVMVGDGKHIYIKDETFDLKCRHAEGEGDNHLIATGLSMLDSYRHHRSLWVLGVETPYTQKGDYTGELLSFNGNDIFSFKAQNGMRNSGQTFSKPFYIGRYKLDRSQKTAKPAKNSWNFLSSGEKIWRIKSNVICKAMVLTGAGSDSEVLYVAGSENPKTKEGFDQALNGTKPAVLTALNGADGKELAKYTIPAPPVFDGMIAIQGKILVALTDGSILCFAK
jgi:outer membrane protein assembly factor BamB